MKVHNAPSCRLVFVLAAALMMGCGTTIVRAQPDPNDAPKAQNPAAQNPMPPMPFGNQDWQKMTPDERRAATRQVIEQMLRGSMTALGLADKTTQDAVVASALEQETELEIVREKHRAVVQALTDKATTDEQMLIVMTDLQASIQETKSKRGEAIAVLDAKIHFSKNPRLAAYLSLSGVTGDESQFIGGTLGSFLNAMGNVAAAQPPAAPNPNVAPAAPPR